MNWTELACSRLLSKNLKINIHKTKIFPVVLYGCETWSLTLRKECWLRILENRIPRRILEPRRDENGEWRRLHYEEGHSLYRSSNTVKVIKSRRLIWAGHVVRMEGRSAIEIPTCTPTGKRPLGRHRCRWEGNIRMHLK